MASFVGSRISLTTQTGMRVEGILVNLDPETSQMTLQQVKFFGTEGRSGNPATEIPPSETIFPLITFQGSEVADLKVIQQSSFPPPNPFFGQFQQPPYGWQHMGMAPPMHQPVQGNMPGFSGGLGLLQPQQVSQPPTLLGTSEKKPATSDSTTSAEAIKTQGSTTAPKSPVDTLSSKLGNLNVTANNSAPKLEVKQQPLIAPQSPSDLKKDTLQPTNPWKTNSSNNNKNDGEKSDRNGERGQVQQHRDGDRQAYRGRGMGRGSYNNNRRDDGYNDRRDGDRRDNNNNRRDGNDRGYNNRRDGNNRDGNERRDGQRHSNTQRNKIVIPDSDFDFESANAKFEEEKEKGVNPTINGTVPDESASKTSYSKTSFFDDISCESKDRAEQEQVDRYSRVREERRLNLETFGQTGARNNRRGGQRGRGGYNRRGRGQQQQRFDS